MTNFSLRLSILAVLCLIAFLQGESAAQSSAVPTAVLVRGQVVTIAEELIPKVSQVVKDSARILLSVESNTAKTFIENAFIEMLTGAGFKVTVGSNGTANPSMKILVIEQGVRFQGISSGGYARIAKTTLEVRLQEAHGAEVHYLGSFSRELSDTVAQRDEPLSLGFVKEDLAENSTSFFEKIAGPVLMIAGVFVIVYLFFTVRS